MSNPRPPTAAEVAEAFLADVQAQGFNYSSPVIPDGEKHRVALDDDKPGEKSGEYALHLNGKPAGMARDYRKHGLGEDIHWKWGGDLPPRTDTDRRAQAEESARRQAEREAEKARAIAAAAAKAQLEWDAAGEPAPDHGYLRVKGIKPHGIKQAGPVLLVPVIDTADKLHGLQRIHENADKRFGKDETKAGHFAPVGDWKTAAKIFIGEGYATVVTVHETHDPGATAAICAFDKGNLAAVAHVIRQARPDAEIILCADNDQWKKPGENPGVKFARAAAEAIGAPVVIPTFAPRHYPPPGVNEGPTDFNDLAKLEGAEEVRRQIAEQRAAQVATPNGHAAEPTSHPAPAHQIAPAVSAATADEADQHDEEAMLRGLATLAGIEYGRQRKSVADELGVTVTILDTEVKRVRQALREAARVPLVEPVEPWPNRVNGGHLIADIRALVARYMILPDGAADALPLWIIGTYCFDAFRIFPKLLITSPEKRCGKSTLLASVSFLVNKGLAASNISASAIFRVIEAASPTLCIDEADTFINNNDDLRGVVNSGHTKSTAYVIRVESNKVTGEQDPKRFSTWAPMCIAMIKDPPDTIRDRSISIRLRRRMPGESVAKQPLDLQETCLPVRRRCAAWADEHMEELRGAEPVMPMHANDRGLDNWTPLFAIAEAIGGDWPKMAREAFKTLTPGEDEDDSIGPMILADMRRIFAETGKDKLHVKDLVTALIELEERPWGTWKNGKPLTGNSLAKLLKPFGIVSDQMKIADINLNGYQLKDMDDAFTRYLPAPPGAETAKPHREKI